MKKITVIFLLIGLATVKSLFGQVSVPYFSGFDNPIDTIGWSHYATSNTDDWELGTPAKNFFQIAYSQPNAWVTDLDTSYAANSTRALESPYFDLSDTSSIYSLCFYQQRQSTNSVLNYFVEYKIGNSINWQILNYPFMGSLNWQGSSGFTGNYAGNFQKSAFELSFLQGQDSVKFRFRFYSSVSAGDGWMIDNFTIEEPYYNLHANLGDSIFVSQNCSNFNVSSWITYSNYFTQYFNNTAHYYLSNDSILDVSDSLLSSVSSYINSSTNINQSFNLPSGIGPGYYYILYQFDALNILQELNENDNIGYAVLKVDSVYSTPYIQNFEDSLDSWIPGPGNTPVTVWELGEGYRHHIEGSHSGTKSWHTSQTIIHHPTGCNNNCIVQDIYSPYIDLNLSQGFTVLNFWYKNNTGNFLQAYFGLLEYSTDCESSIWDEIDYLPLCTDDEWDYINYNLNWIAPSNNVRFRIKFEASYIREEGINFDDVYIGPIKPDLSIERDNEDRFTSSLLSSDTLKYLLNNCGLVAMPSTISSFYWSNDTIFDVTDILLGTKTEVSIPDTSKLWTSFVYSKPTLTPGKYYIFYKLDTLNAFTEMREYNNTGYFTISQESPYTIPYFNDFETSVSGWKHNSSLGFDEWEWAVPNGTLLDTAFSGTKAWITNDTGAVSPMSRMHLYSPVFDLSSSINPVIEFDMKLSSDPLCYCSEAKTNMSYSIDGGATWNILDTTSMSFNRWYLPIDYENGIDYINDTNYTLLLDDFFERAFVSLSEYNGRDSYRNTRYVLDIGFLSGVPQLQFRYNLATLLNSIPTSTTSREGAMIDNFSIHESFVDLNVNYKKSLMISSNAQNIKFFMNIKNQGNYISMPGTAKFYVSADTILTGADYLLGQTAIPSIRPDLTYYINKNFLAPGNLSNYNYLIYELDDSNANTESNEINNIGFWPLALDSISSYPYFNDFNDSIINGWHQFSLNNDGINMSNFRFRNMLAPAEEIAATALTSGQWFTERLPNGSFNYPPYFYLESPVFNFSSIDSIFLSFDLMCSGKTYLPGGRDGGNFHFSTDGGNNWTVLTASYGQATNWYDYNVLNELDNEPGWAGPSGGYNFAVFDSCNFDASFLKGQENVVFRFKYKSNHTFSGPSTAQGMRLDNFKIEGFKAEYIANDILPTNISANLTQPDFNINYSITNSGEMNGRVTKTKFYWSGDSILDAGDIFFHQIIENSIPIGSTYFATAAIPYPPINQTLNYLFYITDGDSIMAETNELNNIGVYKVTFPSFTNYLTQIESDTINALIALPGFDFNYSIINSGLIDGANSSTNIYWSQDSILDVGDQSIYSINLNPILSGDTLISMASVVYPLPITSSMYYMFVKADNSNTIMEGNEIDNLAVTKILFDTLNTLSDFSNTGNIDMYIKDNLLYINMSSGKLLSTFELNVINSIGQKLQHSTLDLVEGQNQFLLANNLASGIYLIILQNNESILTKKLVLEN